jgi:hypothetical protein
MEAKRVFVNCPFDEPYKPLFDAIVFAILDLGFLVTHGLADQGDPLRLKRISDEMRNSRYSIHDLSRIETDIKTGMPRFNMPFEAGMAYSLHQSRERTKRPHDLLLLDSAAHRFQASISDVAGLDPKVHDGKPGKAILAVRTFLRAKSGLQLRPHPYVLRRYQAFRRKLGGSARTIGCTAKDLRSWDYIVDLQALMERWIAENKP